MDVSPLEDPMGQLGSVTSLLFLAGHLALARLNLPCPAAETQRTREIDLSRE